MHNEYIEVGYEEWAFKCKPEPEIVSNNSEVLHFNYIQSFGIVHIL